MVTREEIIERAERVKAMSGIHKYGIINEYREMAEGGSAYRVREEYYPDWSDQDFVEVLKLLGEDEG